MNTPIVHCPVCLGALPQNRTLGLCPQCLLKEGLAQIEELQEPTLQDQMLSSLSHPGVNVRYFGHYELIEEIGRGGMGVIYKARQTNLNRVVAVKMILTGSFATETEIRRFQGEAEAAANLQHPNIVGIHEVGLHSGLHYFSMDFVEGLDLARTLAVRKFTPLEAASCIQQLAEAIHYAHLRGILHRDLKPQNVLIDRAGTPKIADFGLARKLETDNVVTKPGSVLGSPAYMSPEQARGRLDQICPASDVYSLGAILFEMLTGKPPFRNETIQATLRDVIELPPTPPSTTNPGLPRDLETICLKCLEKQPERRYSSARELAEDLAHFRNSEPVRARPAGTLRKGWLWLQRHPWTFVGAVSMALCLMALLTFGLWQKIQFLSWKSENPGSAPSYQPFLGQWMEEFSMPGKIALGWIIALVYLSGPLLFLDYISRKRQPMPIGRNWLAGYGAVGILELVCGLAWAFTLVKLVVWGDIGWNMLLAAFAISSLIVSFPFWVFGSNLVWCAFRDHRFMELGLTKQFKEESHSGHAADPFPAILIWLHKSGFQIALWLSAALAVWSFRQIGLMRPYTYDIELPPFLIAAATTVGISFARNALTTPGHKRLFFLAGALLAIGGAMGGVLEVVMFCSFVFPTLKHLGWVLGGGAVLMGLGFWAILRNLGRTVDQLDPNDFRTPRNGSLLWSAKHPRAVVITTAILTAANLIVHQFLEGTPGTFFSTLVFLAAPQLILEFRRSHGAARESRSVLLGISAVVLAISSGSMPVLFLVFGCPLLIVLGGLSTWAQIRWERLGRPV